MKYFLQDCVKNLVVKMKNISCSLYYQRKKGECLLLSRSYKSSKHLRIYQKVNELEFEPGTKK